jgi:hypothetical protein
MRQRLLEFVPLVLATVFVTACGRPAARSENRASIPEQPPPRQAADAHEGGAPRGARRAQLLDGNLPLPEHISMVGVNARQALLELFPVGFGVLDLESGCLDESYPPFARLGDVLSVDMYGRRETAGKDIVPAELSSTEVQEEVHALIALVSRFNAASWSPWRNRLAWSPDGSKIFAAVAGLAYLSRDGGKTFHRVDDHSSSMPSMTADGRWATLLRCRTPAPSPLYPGCADDQQHQAILSTTGEGLPRSIGHPGAWFVGEAPDGKLVFSADEPRKLCIDHVDPASSNITRAFCLAVPPRAKDDSDSLVSVARGGHYGAASLYGRAHSTFILFSMKDGRILNTLQQTRFDNVEVDDRGKAAWRTDGREVGVAWEGGTKSLGEGNAIGWDRAGRLLIHDTRDPSKEHTMTLGGRRCDLVRVVSVGP